jgi:hypothetical protein
MRAFWSILAVGGAVAGLAAATSSASGPEWKAVLKPGAGSSITGKAEVEGKDDKSTKAEISIKGAMAGAELPWHVHSGKCGSGGPVVGAGTAYPLLKVKRDGEAEAEAKLDIAAPTSGDYHVSVHKSAADMKTIVACGDLVLQSEKDKAKTSGSGY